MPLRYIVKASDTGVVELFEEKDETKPSGQLLGEGDIVVVDPDNNDNDQDWLFVESANDPEIKGFIPIGALREPAPSDVVRFPLALIPFVRSCGRAELASVSADDESSPTVLADYLLAWAYIESSTEKTLFSNPLPDFEGSDAEGPFRLTTKDWKEYQTAAQKTGIEVSDFERLIPSSQVSGAAFKSLSDFKKFADLETPATEPVDGPFVPSYLNVLHCHFLGVDAAHKFQELKNENLGGKSIMDALDGLMNNDKRDAIIKNREKFMMANGSPVTIDMFFVLTSQALADGFKKALAVIREHADFLLPPLKPFAGGPPWMTVAEREKKIWEDENLKEGTGKGLQKVIEYFKAVQLNTTKNQPWCGAFVGYCLQEAKPSFKSIIVKGGAKAANWMNWGNLNIRQFDLRDIPQGAVVITHPLSEGTSGHVGFAAGKVPGSEKIVLLGGNQGNSVTLRHIHKNKIRQIRWHNDISEIFDGKIGSQTDPKLKMLLSLIASKESNGNYNAYFGNAGNQTNPKFTTMSVKAVRAWQDKFVASGKKSSAVGKYQIIRKTMDEVIKRANIKEGELFDENLQDKMALNLLEKRKINNFLSGQIDITSFGNLLAMEWASFPVLSSIKNTKGRIVKRGQSFYAGDGLNKAHVMPEQVEFALESLRSNTT